MNNFDASDAFTAILFCGWAGIWAQCERVATQSPYVEPPEYWCAPACARWQMLSCSQGNDVCIARMSNGTCFKYESCLVHCEENPDLYPSAQCAAEPPAITIPLDSCAQLDDMCEVPYEP